MEQYLTPKIALVWSMKINDFIIIGALILLAVNEAKTEIGHQPNVSQLL